MVSCRWRKAGAGMTAVRLAQLDALQIAINNLRFEANRGNVDYETADMREFLLAAYAMTEILSLIHISEPTRPCGTSRMPSSA